MIFYQEPTATVYCGHVLKELAGLPDSSVDCVITSPPYWGLRTYKTEPIIWDAHNSLAEICARRGEHEWGDSQNKTIAISDKRKDMHTEQDLLMNGVEISSGNSCLKCGAWKGELGLEPTIELYIDHLLQIFDEIKRVLKKTGTLWVNIGDSYAGSGSGGGGNQKGNESGEVWFNDRPTTNLKSYPAKSLCLIPERFALGMVERGWILRNNIIWYKPNPMPESVKDRFTGSYEVVYFFVKNKKYWFEQQFEAHISIDESHFPSRQKRTGDGNFPMSDRQNHFGNTSGWNPSGRNKRDVWEINTQPSSAYQGIRNFATFPEKLCETPILAGCPSAVCKKCGKAREKILEQGEYQKHETEAFDIETHGQGANRSKHSPPVDTIDKGYTDCDCGAGFEPGILLDPFCGSGRALAVAKKLGRKAIGIDLSRDYCKMTVSQLQAIPIPMEL